ncbi:MAG: DNA recombination protein RmuC [Candidatus Ancillula sp.]|jgi:DNA recombination protein RmuC|nr:DNA recombination protein RmuC [Candidatus Ancillula sp.]
MEIVVVILGLVVLLLGGGLFWAIRNSIAGSGSNTDFERVKQELLEKSTEFNDLQIKYSTVVAKSEGLEQQFEQFREQVAVQKVELQSALNYEREQLKDERQLRKDELERLKAEQLEAQKSEGKVLEKLAPVSETIKKMQQKVEELEGERKEQFGSLSKELKNTRAEAEKIQKVSGALASALKSNQSRGKWGEAQLRTIVEATGMLPHVNFNEQTAISGTHGASRPDMVIHLPGEKSIIIDAKVPADKFFEAMSIDDFADEDAQKLKDTLLNEHVEAVRRQVDLLSKKEYWDSVDSTPDFVIMFIPSEAMLSSALEKSPTLLEEAFKKRIALASPVSLFSVLKTVSFVWQQQALNENAKELGNLAVELLGRVKTMAGHSDNLAKSLEKTVQNYNKFATSLESNVLTTANKIADKLEKEQLESPSEIAELPREFKKAALIEGAV